MSLNYDELNQQDRQLADNLAMQYDQLNADQRMFYDDLQYKQDSFLADLGFQYDQLDIQSKQFDQELLYKYDIFNRELDYKYDELLSQEARFGSELGYKYDSLKQQWEELLFKAENDKEINDANNELRKWLAEFEQENALELKKLEAEQMAKGNEAELRSVYLEAYKLGALGSGFNYERKTGYSAGGKYTYTEAVRAPILSYEEWISGKQPTFGRFR